MCLLDFHAVFSCFLDEISSKWSVRVDPKGRVDRPSTEFSLYLHAMFLSSLDISEKCRHGNSKGYVALVIGDVYSLTLIVVAFQFFAFSKICLSA